MLILHFHRTKGWSRVELGAKGLPETEARLSRDTQDDAITPLGLKPSRPGLSLASIRGKTMDEGAGLVKMTAGPSKDEGPFDFD
ncbi:hypothetical protein RUM43_005637 [Polyplax serrata]|uniref:Uncharacterized protein n=1 Tax=Polyplax serrata TaxID=468196 RepID=A0AAN8PBG6_POLSC